MATINKPLNVDNPPKPAVAQQYPKVVVGNITRPSNGALDSAGQRHGMAAEQKSYRATTSTTE